MQRFLLALIAITILSSAALAQPAPLPSFGPEDQPDTMQPIAPFNAPNVGDAWRTQILSRTGAGSLYTGPLQITDRSQIAARRELGITTAYQNGQGQGVCPSGCNGHLPAGSTLRIDNNVPANLQTALSGVYRSIERAFNQVPGIPVAANNASGWSADNTELVNWIARPNASNDRHRAVILTPGHMNQYDCNPGGTQGGTQNRWIHFGLTALGRTLLENGYTVDFSNSPGCGEESAHEAIMSGRCWGLQWFWEPANSFINWSHSHMPMLDYSIQGFSGSGASVIEYAAMDPRIRLTVSMDGFYPTGFFGSAEHNSSCNWGIPPRYSGRDILLMAATEPGRMVIQTSQYRSSAGTNGCAQMFGFGHDFFPTQILRPAGGSSTNMPAPVDEGDCFAFPLVQWDNALAASYAVADSRNIPVFQWDPEVTNQGNSGHFVGPWKERLMLTALQATGPISSNGL